MQSQLAVGQESIQFIPPHPSKGSEEPISVSGCYKSTSSNTCRPEGLECGSKSGTDQSCAANAWWTLGW